MQNPTAAHVHYSEYQSNGAWVNDNDWQFERPAKRHPVRLAIAKVLIALATALSPATKRETQIVA
jgi:hypothetical protein